MAIDDVISDYDTDITNGSSLTIQPGSGDEWHLTHLIWEASPGWDLQPHTNAAAFISGLEGAETTVNVDLLPIGIHPISLILDNTEHIRMLNGVGTTRNAGYSAIKMKD